MPTSSLLQVAVCDVTPADPEDELVVRPVTISILRTDVEFPDAGVPVEDAGTPEPDAGVDAPPDPMCSCQTAPGPPGANTSSAQRTKLIFSLFAMGATLVAFTVRGVRHKRRGTSMKPTTKRD